MSDCYEPIEIDTSGYLRAVAFSADGEHLVSCGDNGVEVWGVHDGTRVASMQVGHVSCLAVSQDGRWIAAGTSLGDILVWNVTTHKQVFKHSGDMVWDSIHGIDFSPDSKRLVSASEHKTTIWDFETAIQIQTRHHPHELSIIAAKYSPQGDKIATATKQFIEVWDSKDGTPLLDIVVPVVSRCNNGLLWSDDHLLVISDGKIKEFDASTGSMVMEWEVPGTSLNCCISLPKHGEFIAYSTEDTVTFWDTLTRTQLTCIQYTPDIRSIAISFGNWFAIGGYEGKIVLESCDRIIIGQDIQIDTAALDAWKQGRLNSVEESLTRVIATSRNVDHHTFANRAVIRARLQNWSMALEDANAAIDIQPSVIGYIAKGVAHTGNEEKYEAYRACDLAFLYCRPSRTVKFIGLSDNTFLLLMKAIIVFMAGDHVDAISRMNDLIATVRPNPIFYVVQAHMHLLVGDSHTKGGRYVEAMQSLQRAQVQLRPYAKQLLLVVSLISGWKFDDLDIRIRQGLCKALYSMGRAKEAGDALLKLVQCFQKKAYESKVMVEWISDFTQRCLSAPGTTSIATQSTDALLRYTDPAPLLMEWAKSTLANRSWRDALGTSTTFVVPKCAIYRTVCERLEANDCTTDAIDCLLEMASELARTANFQQTGRIVDFRDWCSRKLEELGDDAMGTRQHDKAIVRYTAALSLKPINAQSLFAKRSKARANMGLWQDALDDADEVIMLDPSSPLGYERKHAALRGGHYEGAEAAFETMLAKMTKSTDPEIRERASRYVLPAETESSIRGAIQNAIRESPLVLIDTDSGRLLDKIGQASSFESQPIFHELVSSMTTQIDHSRIQDEVGQYYRYATFSHKWKANEPSYEKVIHTVVYGLEKSPTHEKLQNFCKIVREAGLHWAWTDTCCINKADPSVLQEALVSMFRWYQGSSLTVVLLCDVPWRRLANSIWNTRAWTFQEYHASKVVRFFNSDWTLYRKIDVSNHKECPEIIAEMQEAMDISAEALMSLRPGLEDIREKLRLASSRQSTRVEDAAYSLFGIFSLFFPIVYGEGDQALGRLLAQLLMSSGNTSILAWTGESGSFNSCLPSVIAVFSQSPASHLPQAMMRSEMDTMTSRLHDTPLDIASIMTLYNRLDDLPIPLFVGKRMKLPCIVFKLGTLSSKSRGTFRAKTAALGVVDIQTEEDLSRYDSLILVHPWIDFLLDRQPAGSVFQTTNEGSTDVRSSNISGLLSIPDHPRHRLPSETQLARLFSRPGLFDQRRLGDAGWPSPHHASDTTPSSHVESLRPPSTLSESDVQLRAFKMLVWLGQPFGALLLTPDTGGVAAYRRVASESLIRVQVQEITPAILERLINSVRVLDVL